MPSPPPGSMFGPNRLVEIPAPGKQLGPGRGNNGGASRKRRSELEHFQLATQARNFMADHPDIKDLPSHEQRLQKAAKLVGLGKSKGIPPRTLYNWVIDKEFARLTEACKVDPKLLRPNGKFKGGRGNKKGGWRFTSRTVYGPWFPELEVQVDAKITDHRRKRIKVVGRDVIEWMNALVADSARQDEADGREPDERKTNWMGSGGWLAGFMVRKGWVRRMATNKRSHSVEDLLGPILGWVRFLRNLRKDNPSDHDLIWGAFGPQTTFNVDSVPVAFASNSRQTFAQKGAKRISLIVPGSGLDKRQGTLHLAARAVGEQPHPTLILKGATTKDGKPDTKKREAEMEKYRKYKVHVLWQKNAWLTKLLATKHWENCFHSDLQRLGLEGTQTLLMADNLKAQKVKELRAALNQFSCTAVYGPKNGTDVWQPVDHGLGRRYQVILEELYQAWTKTLECLNYFRSNKAPSAQRRRELMVQWVHTAYERLEKERAARRKHQTSVPSSSLHSCGQVHLFQRMETP